jgi:hypothetical protein
MPTVEERLIALERQIKIALATTSAFQGQPADATLSVPHNDSWIFEDNVDATHAANLRYIVSKNITRVVSARLSIFMAPYRTYNSLSLTATGADSPDHTHNVGIESGHNHGHGHTVPIAANAAGQNVQIAGVNGSPFTSLSGPVTSAAINSDSTGSSGHTHGASAGRNSTHTHTVSGSAVLGVTEGATATGVTISFDGVDATVALGGPFNADVIELDVRRFIQIATGVKHTIAMQPSGLGRIEAHLRLGVYVSAGQVL